MNDISNMTGKELTAEFNRLADLKGYERVKRFPNLEIGRLRLQKIISAPSALPLAAQAAAEQPTTIEKAKKPSHKSWRAKGIILKADKNPRQVGTKAYALYDAMAAYVRLHPEATVGDVLKNTPYRRQDHVWDLKRGFIEEK